MQLIPHLAIHVGLALLAGLIVWRVYHHFWISMLAALAAGVAVDLDHFIDYFIAFGFDFQLDFFNKGYQFLKNDKMYILLHGWEYAILLLGLTILLKKKLARSILLALFLGLSFHLMADVAMNEIPAKSYSLGYRISQNFSSEKLVNPEHYLKDQRKKQKLGF